jgi:hypothetical protein
MKSNRTPYSGISKLTSILAARARPTMLDSLTASLAASSRLSHGRIFMAAEAIRTLASSTFVPWGSERREKIK